MSKRHYVDAFEDTDAETIGLLGSRFFESDVVDAA